MISLSTEAQVKRAVRAILQKYGNDVYYHMPVPGGYGRSTLDYLGFVRGYGFAIETKREKAKPTERQLTYIEQIRNSGTKVFVINSHESLQELDKWLESKAPLTVVK